MWLKKAYHPGKLNSHPIKTQSIALVLTLIALALTPATADAWLSEHIGSFLGAPPAAGRPNGVQSLDPQAAVAPENKPVEAPSGSPPALKAQMAKLLQLATELKSDVDKTNKDMLSLSVVRKAGEIEKLAHDMRDERPSRSAEHH